MFRRKLSNDMEAIKPPKPQKLNAAAGPTSETPQQQESATEMLEKKKAQETWQDLKIAALAFGAYYLLTHRKPAQQPAGMLHLLTTKLLRMPHIP
jgi:hypothetical protein